MNLVQRFQNLPINKKISHAIFWTNIVVLLLCTGAIVSYELTITRRRVFENLDLISHLVAVDSAGALAFGDTAAMERVFLIFADQPQIIAARLYTAQGKPFATYLRRGSPENSVPPAPSTEGTFQAGTNMAIFRDVRFRDDRIGTIYMRSDMSRVYKRIWGYLGIVAGIFAFLIPVVLFIAGILQKIISNPIRELDGVAHQIAAHKKYSIRARVKGQDEIGRLTHTFNTMLDSIEERDKKLVEQAEELKRSNKELEQFAYVSSHDLQEPLRKITTYSQLIETKHKGHLDPETDRFLENICISTARMRMLIANLLMYSRLTPHENIRMGKIDLNKALKDVLNDMDESIKEKKAVVTSNPLPIIRANEVQIQQLFQNLIGNALKFRGSDTPKIHVSSRLFGDQYVIGVHDNGIGIEPQYREKVFQVFQRLHGRDAYPGTGIGLAICKKIVEQNDGKIWVESEFGKGSSFYFTWSSGPQFA